MCARLNIDSLIFLSFFFQPCVCGVCVCVQCSSIKLLLLAGRYCPDKSVMNSLIHKLKKKQYTNENVNIWTYQGFERIIIIYSYILFTYPIGQIINTCQLFMIFFIWNIGIHCPGTMCGLFSQLSYFFFSQSYNLLLLGYRLLVSFEYGFYCCVMFVCVCV